ncbi:MAG: sulfur oxidation c-type cytochrome SoxA [Alphaproteobacteria bacterium]
MPALIGLLIAGLVLGAAARVRAGPDTAGPPAEKPLPSGTTFLGEGLKARQADEALNPGMLWVDEGARLWAEPAGAAKASCASCHGAAEKIMRGVATRYPAVDDVSGTLLNLEGRINRCRTEHQQADAFAYESDALLSLTAYVARQSLGLPMSVRIDGPAASYHATGEAYFHTRRGQLNLSCAQCHVDNAGRRLRGDTISHGLGNGYPIYRLEWQTLGSLQRRLHSCLSGVRAALPPYGAPDLVALELYLAGRARGVALETPAIRR